jgi:hypothetical protein
VSALDLLRHGEICIVIVDGRTREATWHKFNRWFTFRDEPPGHVRPHEVDEWRPKSVKFK